MLHLNPISWEIVAPTTHVLCLNRDLNQDANLGHANPRMTRPVTAWWVQGAIR